MDQTNESSVAPILEPTEENLLHCAERLVEGDVIAVPTETVYGLAGNALCESSLRRIFTVKARPHYDPLIIHFEKLESLKEHIIWNPVLDDLAKAFWPGPLTIVLPKKATIPDIATAGLPSVAVRIPKHPVFRALLAKLPFPLAAPSANPFGYVSPTQAKHVQNNLGEKISAILEGGNCSIGVESTIVDLRAPDKPKILRPGPIAKAEIERICTVTSEKKTRIHNYKNVDEKPQIGPGMLTQHYSPKATIKLFPYGRVTEIGKFKSETNSAIVLQAEGKTQRNTNEYAFSLNGELKEVARNLFSMIRDLDEQGFENLLIEEAPNTGIGIAINDRLRRAAAKK